MYKKTRAEGFGAEVKRRIMIGTYVLAHGYYDAYYLQAQKLRRMIADDFQACFRQCDLIAGPVAPTVAWKLGEQDDDPVKAYLADIFTLPASLAGLPGMSVPAGFGEGGMPVGLQLIGNYFDEGALLHAAHAFQQATDWHTRARPAGPAVQHEQRPPLIRGYEVVIGLETHAQLSTAQQDLQRRVDAVRRRAQHAGLRGRPGAAGHAAGAEPRRGRARHPLRPGGRRQGRAAVDLRAQELLLSRPAQGLPDQPVRDRRWCRAAASTFLRRRAARKRVQPDARPPRGGRRQVAARGLPGPDRHRPEPRRHAAAGDRHRARHALAAPRRWSTPRRCTRWWSGSASATATCRKAASAATPTSRCAGPARRSARGARSRT